MAHVDRALSGHDSTASSQRFLDAALTLFSEFGFNGTSLQMIADQLGVTKAAVGYHFPSKEDLLAAVIAPAFEDLSDTLDEISSIRRESTRRTQGLALYVDYLIRQRRVAAWLSRDIAVFAQPALLELAQASAERINAVFVSDADDPIAQMWGAAITQALSAPIMTPTDTTDEVLRRQLNEIGSVLLRGYRAVQRRAAAEQA